MPSYRFVFSSVAFLLASATVESFAPANPFSSRKLVSCQATDKAEDQFVLQKLAAAAFFAFSIFGGPGAAFADGKFMKRCCIGRGSNAEDSSLTTSSHKFAGQTEKYKFPPIDFNDKNRCRLQSSSIGQANAARDKLYDLRMCKLEGAKGEGFDLSGVIMTNTDVSNANFRDAYFSKGFLHESKFDGADFSNGIIDRASFKGSSLRGAIFTNSVLTGTSFEGADLENADFSDAYLGDFDIRSICKNPTLKGENPTTGVDTRMSVGCK